MCRCPAICTKLHNYVPHDAPFTQPCLILKPDLNAGAAVVFMGSSCRATFDDVVFTPIAVDGAQVTLNTPHFQDMASATAAVSIYAHGAATKVTVQGSTVTGAVLGATLQPGTQLDASGLNITDVQTVGVNVMGQGSSLQLSDCKMHGFANPIVVLAVYWRCRAYSLRWLIAMYPGQLDPVLANLTTVPCQNHSKIMAYRSSHQEAVLPLSDSPSVTTNVLVCWHRKVPERVHKLQ